MPAGVPKRDDGDEAAQTHGHELDEKFPVIKSSPAAVLSRSAITKEGAIKSLN